MHSIGFGKFEFHNTALLCRVFPKCTDCHNSDFEAAIALGGGQDARVKRFEFVKKIVLGAVMLIGVGGASASESPDPAVIANSAAQMDPTLFVPSGVVLREIFRIFRPSTNTHVTNYYWPENWEDIGYLREGGLGFISSTPFENSVLIRSCVGPHSWNYFTSRDPDCESETGGVVLPGDWNIGYISTVQLPGTVPLYRCSFVWDRKIRHFDTLQVDCEGVREASNEGATGYVFL